MDKRKIIKSCLIIFAIFLILAFAEIAIRFIIKGTNKIYQNIKEEKKQEEFYNSDSETTKRNIETFVLATLDAIKDKDYNYVFSALDDVYKSYMFGNDISKVEEYFKDYIPESATYQISKIENIESTYKLNVTFLVGNKYSTKYINVVVRDNNYYLYFGDYNYILLKENISYLKDGIKYEINYYYKSNNLDGYVLDITNNTDTTCEIEINDVKLLSTRGTYYPGICNVEKISIEPKSNERVELLFNNVFEGMTYLELNVLKDRENIQIQIYNDIEM